MSDLINKITDKLNSAKPANNNKNTNYPIIKMYIVAVTVTTILAIFLSSDSTGNGVYGIGNVVNNYTIKVADEESAGK